MVLLKPDSSGKARMQPLRYDIAIMMWKHIAGEQTAPAALHEAIAKVSRIYLNIKDKDVPRSYLERYHSDLVEPAVQVSWWQK